MMKNFTKTFFSLAFSIFIAANVNSQSCSDGTFSYDDDVLSILTAKCSPCHTANNTAGWTCTDYASTLAAGNLCGPGVTPGDINASSLYNKIKHSLGTGLTSDCGQNMPTNANILTAAEAQIVTDWIAGGAQESCPADVLGCTNSLACNYDVAANADDNSCILIGDSCDDMDANTLNDVIGSDCMCTGIVGIEDYKDFYFSNIYPLPVKDVLNISFTNSSYIGSSTLTIYDNVGKVVELFENEAYTNTDVVSVTLNDKYANGVYFISLKMDEKTITRKIVVQK